MSSREDRIDRRHRRQHFWRRINPPNTLPYWRSGRILVAVKFTIILHHDDDEFGDETYRTRKSPTRRLELTMYSCARMKSYHGTYVGDMPEWR